MKGDGPHADDMELGEARGARPTPPAAALDRRRAASRAMGQAADSIVALVRSRVAQAAAGIGEPDPALEKTLADFDRARVEFEAALERDKGLIR